MEDKTRQQLSVVGSKMTIQGSKIAPNTNEISFSERAFSDALDENTEFIDFGRGKKEVSYHQKLGKMQRGLVAHYCSAFAENYPLPPRAPTVARNIFARTMGSWELYPLLCLFDCIDLPSTTTIQSDDELTHLIEIGEVLPTHLVSHGEYHNEIIRRNAFDIFRLRDKREPGKWSMWHIMGDDPIPPEASVPNLAFKLKLENTLIVPDANVPLEDILNFRERRKPELMALRHHIDEICIKIAAMDNPEALRAMNVEVEKLEMAVANHIRVSKEPNWKKFFGDIQVEMNWTKMAAFGLAATIVNPTPLGVLLGASIGALADNFSIKSVRGFDQNKPKTPFSYITHIHSEFDGQI